MQTIILTDNKRLSTDYYTDKTLFAQKIDVNHILNTQVYQSHISKVRFWIIRTNIYNEELLVHQLCKNLVNRGPNLINFQFSITKIALPHQNNQFQQKRLNIPLNDRFKRSSRVSGYLTPNTIKTLQFPQFMNKKQSNHTKTTSGLQWLSHTNQLTIQQHKRQQQKQSNINNQSNSQTSKQQEQINLKLLFKKQFQISTLNELSNIFMSKQCIFEQFGMNQQMIMKNKRMVTTYLFKQNDIQIGLSVVSEGCKKYIQKAINIQISEAFNIQFNSRKQAYQSTCLNENFSASTLPKSMTKLTHQIQKQTYHKILLFLFTHYDPQIDKNKVSSSNLSQTSTNKQHNRYIQSIQQWKMKDQDINITQKLSKQYVLIKQQVENEKVSFKNKLKIFEAIIGQSVNVDKLLNQQKQMQSNNTSTNLNPINTQGLINGTINDINSRQSRRSQMKQLLNSPQQISSTNSQFKRLKQSFEMIRNIDNVINQQNKKIQTLKKYMKEIQKSKNEILYQNARSVNQVKKQIKQIKQEIKTKQIEFQYKKKKLQEQRVDNKRNFKPSQKAQNILNSNIEVFKQIIYNERTNKNNQKYLLDDELLSSLNNNNLHNGNETKNKSIRNSKQKSRNKQTKQKQNINISSKQNKENNDRKLNQLVNKKTVQTDNKKFMIRKQHKSFYNLNQTNISHISNDHNLTNTVSQEGFNQFNKQTLNKSNSRSILSTIHKQQMNKQIQLMNKRKQEVENHNIWMNVNQQKLRKSNFQQKPQYNNQKQKEVLIILYKYYLNNKYLLQKVNNQLNSYHLVHNPNLLTKNSRLLSSSVHSKQNKLNSPSVSQFKNAYHSQLNYFKSNSNTNNFMNKSINTGNKSQLGQMSKPLQQINMLNFPLLNSILNPKISQSAFQSQQCSVISDIIQQDKVSHLNLNNNQNNPSPLPHKNGKRVTLQNMIKK